MARRLVGWLLACSLLGGTLLADLARADTVAKKKSELRDEEDYYELYKLLADTVDQVERNYVKDVDRRELIEAAIEGVLAKLDPYSAYISPDELGRFRSTVESEFGGIGIQITMEKGQLKVLSPLVGTPAYRAGLLAGDRILEIDDEPTAGIDLDEAVRRLKGKEGTSVKLLVVHPGRKNKEEVHIVREVIRVETVLGDRRKPDDTWDFMLDPKKRIGYIRVTAFSRDTPDELRAALDELKRDKLRGLILDLRFNPGGLLNSAIEVADLFVASGRIVSTKGRNSPERTWDAESDGTFQGFPMVVLVNRYSASASEIVAACLQDHGRAEILGERTWGKGSVQNVIELEEGRSALKLTTAGYLRPSGKNIHRFPDAQSGDEWGVKPNAGLELRLGDQEILDLVEARRQRDIVRANRHAASPEPDGPDGQTSTTAPGEKRVERPAAGSSDPESDADPEEPRPEAPPPKAAAETPEPDAPEFVDRQLKLAVERLAGKLAKAD